MARRTSLRALSCAVLLALLVTALHPQPAYADEAAPPPIPEDPAAQAADPAADAAGEAPAAPAAPEPADPAALPEEAATAPDTPPPPQADPDAAASASDSAAEPDAAPSSPDEADAGGADLLAAVPDGTTVAVLDAEGAPVPLVSDEAQAIAAAGDPVWCPASVKAPTPGANGCTASYTSFTGLLGELAALPTPADGVIWIAEDYDSSLDVSPVSLNNTNLPDLVPFKLTLRGGWDGTPGSKTISGTSTFDTTGLYVLNWQNDVTLTDIEITGVTSGYALNISTSGAINLTRVHVHDNTVPGARLTNDVGTSTGKVTVTASQFNDNGNGGLVVYSYGAITLADVTASGNALTYGAYLDNQTALAAQPVTLNGTSTFSDNGLTGLAVFTKGKITAGNLTASGNASGDGVELHNNIGTAAPASPGVTLTGTNVFTGNGNSGLTVISYGPIALTNVTANANVAQNGVYLSNDGAVGALPVTLSGVHSMKYNGAYGLQLFSNGKVTVGNLTASGNGAYGAYIDNATSAMADVALTGAGAFHDNSGTGLYVYSSGAIAAANLTADRNGGTTSGFGALLDNTSSLSPKGISLTGVNAFHSNWSGNLQVTSKGAITASNLTASGSDVGAGASLNNAVAAPQKVTLSGTNTFDDNALHGLEIESIGAISVSSPRASGNGTAGTYHGVYLHNNGGTAAQPVTLTGSGLFLDNTYHGLLIQSLGAITAANLTSRGNGGAGAFLTNSDADDDAPQKVTLTGTNVFSGNYETGLIVDSKGAIAVSNLTACGSRHGYGASLRNSLGDQFRPQNITLSGTGTFDDNYSIGLFVNSYGTVTLASASAARNGIASGSGDGINIDNGGGDDTLPRGITLSGAYSLTGNEDTGLSLRSRGVIKVNNVTAHGNGNRGLYLFNSLADASGGLTLTGSTVLTDNHNDGMYASSYGAITAANLTATGNGILHGSGYGAMLINYDAASPQPVKFTGTNTFSGNQSGGLYLSSAGAVSIAGLTASGNLTGTGAEITNANGPAATTSPGITLTGASTFLDNDGEGLVLSSYGALTASSLTASGNGHAGVGSGATLNNSGSVGLHAVKLTGTNAFNDNQYAGLVVATRGAVALSSLTARGNATGAGVNVQNNYVGSTGGIILSGVNRLEDNGQTGLHLVTLGPVTLNSVTASRNGLAGSGDGAFINNFNATTAQPVRLTGTNLFHDNAGMGLNLVARGAIIASNLSALRNAGGEGVRLDNHKEPTVPSAVTLTGTNVINDNSLDGLYIVSYGAITINNLTAGGNGTSTNGYGAYLVNTSGATPQAVRLTGTNTFNGNYDGGLGIVASGSIAVNNLTALDNAHADGVTLDNQAGGAGITLTGTNTVSGSFGHGLAIRSTGAVSATRLTADGNNMYGLYITGPADSITLTCGSFTGNGTRGIYAVTDGLLSLIGVVSSGNAMANSLTYGDLDVVRNCPL